MSATTDRPLELTDPRQMRALAHPLRLRLLGILRLDGPATASALAADVGESPALVSYHLRTLGRHGFVHEAPELARDGRERWWRASHPGMTWEPVRFLDTPERAAAANALLSEIAERYAEAGREWLADAPNWSEEWVEAADMSDWRAATSPPPRRSACARSSHEMIERYAATPGRGRCRAGSGDRAGAPPSTAAAAMTDDARIPPRRRGPLFALFAANAISMSGNVAALVAIPWFVLQTTGSAARTGVVAAAGLVPIVVSGFFGGALVDRLGYRRTSVVADLASAGAVAAIPLLHRDVGIEFWQLVVLVFLGGLLDAPGVTARASLLPDVAAAAGWSLERASGAVGRRRTGLAPGRGAARRAC